MQTFLQDLRFSLRHLRKAPGFSIAAIATLALGIGATTAIFSTVNAALLRPLPYPNANDLYSIRTALTDGRVTTGLLSQGEIFRLNNPNLSIARAAGLQQQSVTWQRPDGTPTKVSAYQVTDGFFEVFGLPMTMGTALPPGGQPGNAPPVGVISYRIWRDVYNSDPQILGKPIKFTEVEGTIGGVAPKDFDTPHGADFWFVFRANEQDVNHGNEGFMRLKPGTTLARAESEMASVMAGLAKDFPSSDENRVYRVKPLVAEIVGDLGPILIVVLSATALLLVLACVNVTNLLLARGASRGREMAVRVALGAGRGRLVRQLLTESALLTTAGALAGLFLANIGLKALIAAGASRLPRLESITFDGQVLGFALVTLLISGLIVGFAPALRLASTDLKTLMNESGRSASGGRATARWLNGLMIAEVALAVILVAGAGWLIRSFDNLRTVNPGFTPAGRLTFEATYLGQQYQDPATGRFDQARIDATAQEVLSRIQAINGVVAVGSTSNLPLRSGLENSLYWQIRGEVFDPRNTHNGRLRFASPGFFTAMGIPIVSGRDFNGDDRVGTARVIVVNREFVRRYLGDRDPLGVQVSYGYPTINPQSESTIIGVVENVRQKSLTDAPEPAAYGSDRQSIQPRRTVIVHARTPDMRSLETQIRDAVHKIDPQMAVEFTLQSDLVESALERQQLGMQLMLVFGAAALALAAVGIYGVIAYAASQRTGEVATRLALGATPTSVFGLMLSQGRNLALIGAGIGLLAAYLAGTFVASRLFEVQAHDRQILIGATAVVTMLAFLATAIPAYRIARIDPSKVLRPE